MCIKHACGIAHRIARLKTLPFVARIAFGAVLAAQSVYAQYPIKPIKLVVGLAVGGAPDILARVVGPKLSPLVGQPVVVENRVGSNGTMAIESVARSAPDGYTLIMSTDSMIAINPHLYAKSAVDVLKDIVPVTPVAQTSNFYMVVHPSVPVKSFQEFIQYAKKINPPLAYASVGYGSQHHMAMEMLKSYAGINLMHVPYKGGAPAAAAVLAGEVPVMISGASMVPLIASGKVHGLAVTGRNRSLLFPDLPTIGEFYPGYELTTWIGIFGPAGMPDAISARLRAEVNKVLVMAEVSKSFAAAALEPYIATPEEFSTRIRFDYDKYAKLVKLIGAKVEN